MIVRKYKFLFLPFLAMAVLVLYSTLNSSTVNKNYENQEIAQNVLGQDIQTSLEVNVGEKKYKAFWFEADASKLSLINNFKTKQNAANLVENNGCRLAVNAGFYSPQNEPLGYFVSNFNVEFTFEKNKIMNGILSVNSLDTPRITRSVTKDEPRLAVQTGPMLIENDKDLKANLINDKNARRIVAAITGENKLFFFAITTDENKFSGPEISELAGILNVLEDKLNINIADAVNLDGGSASYFNNGETILTEISPIGALFCQE